MKINTVLGSCDPADLGATLVHEHLLAGMPGWELDNASFDRAREFGKVVGAVEEVKQKGVATLIDPCPMELGRDPEFAAAVSDRTGMRVIMSTGLYNDVMRNPDALPDAGSRRHRRTVRARTYRGDRLDRDQSRTDQDRDQRHRGPSGGEEPHRRSKSGCSRRRPARRRRPACRSWFTTAKPRRWAARCWISSAARGSSPNGS